MSNKINAGAPYLKRFPVSPAVAVAISRSLGGSPSNGDVEWLRNKCGDRIDLESFEIWHDRLRGAASAENAEQMCSKIKSILGRTDRTVSTSELQRLLTGVGECLSLEEYVFVAGDYTQNDRVDLHNLFKYLVDGEPTA